ncbi:MAG: hypothetical protein NUW37_11165 [Planctomycetes bacterium]|nr:hypothetical protein [Planctomycetota bacterium]
MFLFSGNSVIEEMLANDEFRDIVFDIAEMDEDQLRVERYEFESVRNNDPEIYSLLELLDKSFAANLRRSYIRLTDHST